MDLSPYIYDLLQFLGTEELADVEEDKVASIPVHDALDVLGADTRQHLRRWLDIVRVDGHDALDLVYDHAEFHPVEVDYDEARQELVIIAQAGFLEVETLVEGYDR